MIDKGRHNYDVVGYIVDGRITYSKPKFALYRGFEFRNQSCYEVYSTAPILLGILLAIVLIACTAMLLRPDTEVVEFRVSFCDTPKMVDDTLYCYVVNVSDIPVTVSFTDGQSSSTSSYLLPNETLAVTSLPFQPIAIVYNNKYQFPLEVRYD